MHSIYWSGKDTVHNTLDKKKRSGVVSPNFPKKYKLLFMMEKVIYLNISSTFQPFKKDSKFYLKN